MLTTADDCMPALNQKPDATPRPRNGPAICDLECGLRLIAVSVSRYPMRLKGGPADCWLPCLTPFFRRKWIESIPHRSANSSITVSDANAALLAPGAR